MPRQSKKILTPEEKKQKRREQWDRRTQIKNAMRRVFHQSPALSDFMESRRIEVTVYKKDGTPAKRKGVRFKCDSCGELFMGKWIDADHISSVIPLDSSLKEMTLEELEKRIFCLDENDKIDISKLQLLCSVPKKYNNGKASCHRIKTNAETKIRTEHKRNKKPNK